MCGLCGAIMLRDGKTLKVKSIFNDNEYEIKGYSEDAEFKPCTFSFRKNKGDWTKEFKSNDLTGIVINGGFEIKDKARKEIQDKFIEEFLIK